MKMKLLMEENAFNVNVLYVLSERDGNISRTIYDLDHCSFLRVLNLVCEVFVHDEIGVSSPYYTFRASFFLFFLFFLSFRGSPTRLV